MNKGKPKKTLLKKKTLKSKGKQTPITANRTSQILDPRVRKRNYSAIQMAILVSYIIRNNCKCQFVSDPQNQADNTINMINDIYQQPNSDTTIIIMTKSRGFFF